MGYFISVLDIYQQYEPLENNVEYIVGSNVVHVNKQIIIKSTLKSNKKFHYSQNEKRPHHLRTSFKLFKGCCDVSAFFPVAFFR